MHILIAAAGIALAIYFFVIRTRNAANVASDVVDMANDVRLAARRFGFIRKTNQHPVDGIEDARIAMAAIAVSFLELDDYPTKEARSALLVALQSEFGISKEDAVEMTVLGRWLMNECGRPDAAVSRIARRLNRISGAETLTQLMALVQAGTGENGLSEGQRDALDEIKRAFGIR